MQSPLQIKPKLLLRSLDLIAGYKGALAKARAKRLYFKSIKIQSFKSKKFSELDGKVYKFVTNLYFSGRTEGECISILKRAKNLRNFICFDDTINIKHYIQRLYKNIQSLEIFERRWRSRQPLHLIYRSIASLPNLKAMQSRSLTYRKSEIKEEWKSLDKYMSRLTHLEHLHYQAESRNLVSFQSLLKEEHGSPYVSSLSLTISGDRFPSYERAIFLFNEETNQTNQEDQEDDGQSDDQLDEEDDMIKSEMDWFFRYDLFPNLKKLDITIEYDCPYPLNPCIIEGFKAAQKLKQISIVLQYRPVGTGIIFQALQHLPLLKRFHLDITFLQDKDRRLLVEFLQKQTQLISFFLQVSRSETTATRYHDQNEFLENFWKCLEHKPHLRHIHLKSEYWPIESISNGLRQVSLANQLQELSIQAFENIITSQVSPSERVQGLCQLIRQQKESLKRLTIQLDVVKDGNIVNDIIDAISELKELRELDFNINPFQSKGCDDHKDFFEVVFPEKDLREILRVEFNLNDLYSKAAAVVSKLQNLRKLGFTLNTIATTPEPFPKNFFRLLKVLSEMKRLKSIDINLPMKELDEDIKEKIKLFSYKFKDASWIGINSLDEDDEQEIGKTVEEVMFRNALRCDLMF